MVSVLAAGLKVTVGTPSGFTFLTSDVVDEAKIKWGRTSLLARPDKRSLTATLKAPSLSIAKEIFRYALRATVTVDQDNVTQFVGHIDSVEPEKINGHWYFHLTAVEATGWNPSLANTLNTRAGSPSLLKNTLDIVSDISPAYTDPSTHGTITYRQPTDQETITVQQGWEFLATPWPLSFPVWSPTYDRVDSTVWELDSSFSTLVFPANTLEGVPPAQEATELYSSVFLYSGGGLGERQYMSSATAANAYKIGTPNDGHFAEVDNPLALTSYSTAVTFKAADLLFAQITAPREFTLRDRILDDAGYSLAGIKAAFLPYETRRRYASQSGDPFAELWPDTRYWTIGGTITYRHKETRHDMTAGYASKFAAP